MPGSHCRLLLNHSIAAILRVPGSSFAFFANANLSPLLALLHVAMSSQYSCSVLTSHCAPRSCSRLQLRLHLFREKLSRLRVRCSICLFRHQSAYSRGTSVFWQTWKWNFIEPCGHGKSCHVKQCKNERISSNDGVPVDKPKPNNQRHRRAAVARATAPRARIRRPRAPRSFRPSVRFRNFLQSALGPPARSSGALGARAARAAQSRRGR